MESIDLNCDMGELMPGEEENFDMEIMPYISSCNIACGFHSGSPHIIEATMNAAIQHGVKIGAHPSYNDPSNFGRKSIQVPLPKLLAELRYQICAIKGMLECFGEKLNHVKPHGALYNDMAKQAGLADAVVQLIKSIDPGLKVFALAHSPVVERCKKHSMACVQEGFADRAYQQIDQLRSRTLEGAVIHEPSAVLRQIDGFLNKEIQLWEGEKRPIEVQTICLHSDTEGAVALSKMIHKHLTERDVQIAAF